MIAIPVALAAIGFFCLLLKRNLIGMAIGIVLLFYAAAACFSVGGVLAGLQSQGHVYGFFVIVAGCGQLLVVFSLATRLFYLKKNVNIETFRKLRH
ncbi:MAG: NADH-quinone oxidoreductase subunit K [Bacteriovoracia bacterium]